MTAADGCLNAKNSRLYPPCNVLHKDRFAVTLGIRRP